MEKFFYEYRHDKDDTLCIHVGKNTLCRNHFHRCLEIIYCTDGKLHATVSDKEFDVEKDDVVFVHTCYPHAFSPVTDYKKIVTIIPSGVSGEFENLLQRNTFNGLLSDKEFNRTVILPILNTLLKDKPATLIQKGYLNVLVGSLFAHYPAHPVKYSQNIKAMVGIINYIDKNYDQPLSLDSLSEEFGYNKYHFSRLFSHYVGDRLNNYINTVRLHYFVKKIQKSGAAHISELAYEVGFDSLPTFYRYFKQVYGVTPREYLAGKRV